MKVLWIAAIVAAVIAAIAGRLSGALSQWMFFAAGGAMLGLFVLAFIYSGWVAHDRRRSKIEIALLLRKIGLRTPGVRAAAAVAFVIGVPVVIFIGHFVDAP